jgi:hypothetical protein
MRNAKISDNFPVAKISHQKLLIRDINKPLHRHCYTKYEAKVLHATFYPRRYRNNEVCSESSTSTCR